MSRKYKFHNLETNLAARTVSEHSSYDAWGRLRNPANWADFNVKALRLITRGYTGHEMLDAFGLINMNGRMYDPVIGRVLSPDRYVQAPGYTQSYNRYSYCFNNPLRFTDPGGWYVMLSNGHKVGNDFNDWGVSNSADHNMPGSGGHWSDGNRSVFGNYMLMGANVFQSYYGVSRNDYNKYLVPNYQLLPKDSHNVEMNPNGERGLWATQRTTNLSYTYITSPNGAAKMTAASTPAEILPDIFIVFSGQGGNDLTNLILNGLNLLAYTIDTRQLPEMAKIDALGPKYLKGVSSASKWCFRIGVGTSAVIGFISVANYFSITNPTWGDNAQLTVGITSSVLSAIPVTTYLGVSLGLIDVAGGFDGWYNDWNNAEIMYNKTGIAVLPISVTNGMPLIISRH